MAKRKEDNRDAVQLQFRDSIVKLLPTAEYPYTVFETQEHESWIDSVSDLRTNTRITNNVDKMRRGLFGDWNEVGGSVFEVRLDFRPGYRVYYAKYESIILILLGGGDKSSQRKDIAAAQKLWERVKDEIEEV